MKPDELSAMISSAALTFQNFELEPCVLATWFRMFQHEDATEFRIALDLAIRNGNDFFPSPGRVNDYLKKVKARHRRTVLPAEAWTRLIALASAGLSESEVFEKLQPHPLVAKALRYVTWSAIRFSDNSPGGSLTWVRKRFLDHYSELLERAAQDRELGAACRELCDNETILLDKIVSAAGASGLRALPGGKHGKT